MRYRVEDCVGRVMMRGDWEACRSFCDRVSDCKIVLDND